jgi:hypothetical protein
MSSKALKANLLNYEIRTKIRFFLTKQQNQKRRFKEVFLFKEAQPPVFSLLI